MSADVNGSVSVKVKGKRKAVLTKLKGTVSAKRLRALKADLAKLLKRYKMKKPKKRPGR